LRRFIPTNRSFIPGSLTAGNMFCGFVSIAFAFEGNYLTASWLIVLAAVFDALDGLIARLTRSYSDFGVEFDSLADVVSFGVAPSVLIYTAHFQYMGKIGLVISFVPLLFGSMRLARFNVMQETFEKGNFIGLPIPIQATALASYLIFSNTLWDSLRFPMLFASYVAFLAFLMMSHFEYESMPKFTFRKDTKNSRKLTLFVVASVLVIIFPQETIFPFSLGFIMFGFFKGLIVHLTQGDEVADVSRFD
jgi:CDP-diacylglycerol---serine O-phosphatidyltransferase